MTSTRLLVAALAGCSLCGSLRASDPPKPGSAEWNRRFREHERRMQEFRRRTRSGTSATGRPKLDKARAAAERLRSSSEERLLAEMTASQRRIHEEASNPRPFDATRAPGADKCLLMFRDALNKPETFSILLQCLAAEHRRDYVRRQVDPNHIRYGQSDREFMASWRRVVGHITSVDSVRNVSGVEGWVDVWANVSAPGLSDGLYRFRMSGEGRFYRLREYRADVIRLE